MRIALSHRGRLYALSGCAGTSVCALHPVNHAPPGAVESRRCAWTRALLPPPSGTLRHRGLTSAPPAATAAPVVVAARWLGFAVAALAVDPPRPFRELRFGPVLRILELFERAREFRVKRPRPHRVLDDTPPDALGAIRERRALLRGGKSSEGGGYNEDDEDWHVDITQTKPGAPSQEEEEVASLAGVAHCMAIFQHLERTNFVARIRVAALDVGPIPSGGVPVLRLRL